MWHGHCQFVVMKADVILNSEQFIAAHRSGELSFFQRVILKFDEIDQFQQVACYLNATGNDTLIGGPVTLALKDSETPEGYVPFEVIGDLNVWLFLFELPEQFVLDAASEQRAQLEAAIDRIPGRIANTTFAIEEDPGFDLASKQQFIAYLIFDLQNVLSQITCCSLSELRNRVDSQQTALDRLRDGGRSSVPLIVQLVDELNHLQSVLAIRMRTAVATGHDKLLQARLNRQANALRVWISCFVEDLEQSILEARGSGCGNAVRLAKWANDLSQLWHTMRSLTEGKQIRDRLVLKKLHALSLTLTGHLEDRIASVHGEVDELVAESDSVSETAARLVDNLALLQSALVRLPVISGQDCAQLETRLHRQLTRLIGLVTDRINRLQAVMDAHGSDHLPPESSLFNWAKELVSLQDGLETLADAVEDYHPSLAVLVGVLQARLQEMADDFSELESAFNEQLGKQTRNRLYLASVNGQRMEAP